MPEQNEQQQFEIVFCDLCKDTTGEYNNAFFSRDQDKHPFATKLKQPIFPKNELSDISFEISPDEKSISIQAISKELKYITTTLTIKGLRVSLIQSSGQAQISDFNCRLVTHPDHDAIIIPETNINPSLVKALIEMCRKYRK